MPFKAPAKGVKTAKTSAYEKLFAGMPPTWHPNFDDQEKY